MYTKRQYCLTSVHISRQYQPLHLRLRQILTLCINGDVHIDAENGYRTHSLYLHFVTARKRSLRQGNIFTPVCHSVHRGGAMQGGMQWGRYPLGRHTPLLGKHPLADTPQADTPTGRHPLGRHPPGQTSP